LPDEDFVLDTHPAWKNIVIGAGFSGKIDLTTYEKTPKVMMIGTDYIDIFRFKLDCTIKQWLYSSNIILGAY